MALRKFMFMGSDGSYEHHDPTNDEIALKGISLSTSLVVGTNKFTVDTNGEVHAAGALYSDTKVDTVDVVASGAISGASLSVTGNVGGGVATFTKVTASGSGGIAFDATSDRIVNVGSPTTGSDATNRTYVDNAIAAVSSGITFKAAVRVRTTTNVNLAAPGSALDGVTMSAGDRVLLAGQTAGAENGIWIWNGPSVAMTRATDFDEASEVKSGAFTIVNEGTSADTGWVLATDGAITVGTTALTFTQFASLASLNGGNGINKDSATNTISVKDYQGISVDTNGVSVDISGTNPGLEFSAAGAAGTLQVKTASANGTTRNASGIAVQLATDPGLQLVAGGLEAKVNSNGGVTKDANGLKVNLATTPGLTATAGLAVQPNNNGGIMVDGSGVAVNLAGTNSGLSKTAGLAVQVNTAGGMTIDGSGLKPNLDTQSLEVSSNAVRVKVDAGATTGAIVRSANGLRLTLEASSPTLQIAANALGVKLGNGVEATAGGLAVKSANADRISVTSSGVDVVGLPSSFEIAGVAVGASVTSANLNTLTNGGNADALHTHSSTGLAGGVKKNYTSNGAIAVGDPVYLDATGKVGKADAADPAKQNVIGISTSAVAGTGIQVEVIMSGATVLPGFSTLTPGARYFLASGGGLTAANTLPGSGLKVYFIGYADATNVLVLQLADRGKQP